MHKDSFLSHNRVLARDPSQTHSSAKTDPRKRGHVQTWVFDAGIAWNAAIVQRHGEDISGAKAAAAAGVPGSARARRARWRRSTGPGTRPARPGWRPAGCAAPSARPHRGWGRAPPATRRAPAPSAAGGRSTRRSAPSPASSPRPARGPTRAATANSSLWWQERKQADAPAKSHACSCQVAVLSCWKGGARAGGRLRRPGRLSLHIQQPPQSPARPRAPPPRPWRACVPPSPRVRPRRAGALSNCSPQRSLSVLLFLKC